MTNWAQLLFETSEGGVSSAVTPELLANNVNAWMLNGQNRGGKPATRPNFSHRLNLPHGLIQGAESFSVQNGMIVASIDGAIYRIRINGNSFGYELIPLGFVNSPMIKQVWMTQTVETLVIQDGQSDAILYNGSVAPRAGPDQVPRGRQMAYGNGRLWVAIDANDIVAGDIRTRAAGSELSFTEVKYLSGGGALFFQSPITGMAFIPVTGQADYGVLLVYGMDQAHAIRADVTSRDDWANTPGFVTNLLRSVGASSQWSLVSVNQDLYWRDSNGGIRSVRNALADETGPGNSPISREVSRLTDYDAQQLLGFCSGVYHDNRLLMTSSPFLLPNGGVGFRDLIALDFAPLSKMTGKSQPAYDGQWSGLNFVKLVSGKFAGKNRAFALVTDDDGNNQLWEFGTLEQGDQVAGCADDSPSVPNPIKSFIEYPLRNFGDSKRRKRIERCDVWLSDVRGELDLRVDWRADNSQKWLEWDDATTCAKVTDAATNTPHHWKNLLGQERPQFKTFTIPDFVNEVVKYAAQVGFEFQIRLSWTGQCRIHRVMVMGTFLDDPDYADRAGFGVECVENDVTGNQIIYRIPDQVCPLMEVSQGMTNIPNGGSFGMGLSSDAPIETVFTITNIGLVELETGTVVSSPDANFTVISQPASHLASGDSSNFTVRYDTNTVGSSSEISIPNNGNPNPFQFNVSVLPPQTIILVVGGGGAGGQAKTDSVGDSPTVNGGGGGAGGFKEQIIGSIIDNTISYDVLVGSGGAPNVDDDGSDGTGSHFIGGLVSLSVDGGGGGGGRGHVGDTNPNGHGSGHPGASGGGGSGWAVNRDGGAGVGGEGNDGGTGISLTVYDRAGGGGGAGGIGEQGSSGVDSISGDGGPGLSSFASGTLEFYCGGGGGAGPESGKGTGGSGSGGNGAGGLGSPAGAGVRGGGGGGGNLQGGAGGVGSPGIVIIRYTGHARFTGGTITTVGDTTIHTFTSSGTLAPI